MHEVRSVKSVSFAQCDLSGRRPSPTRDHYADRHRLSVSDVHWVAIVQLQCCGRRQQTNGAPRVYKIGNVHRTQSSGEVKTSAALIWRRGGPISALFAYRIVTDRHIVENAWTSRR